MATAAFDRARAAHAAQDLDTAWEAASLAAKHAPGDPATAFLLAQVAFESWRPSAELFEQAVRLDRSNPQLLHNFVAALAEEGQRARADSLLSGILARSPGWLEGHAQLSTLRLTAAESDPFRSYAEASAAAPAIRLAWFHRLATARLWNEAEAVLAGLEQDQPAIPGVVQARVFLDCETGKAAADPAIFTPFSGQDPGLALTQVRHALRHGEPARAEAIAACWDKTAHAAQFWPYRDLAWRLLGDSRHAWLHGAPPFAAVFDLPLDPALPGFLRGLHSMQAPYPEQSVRGGTQTSRNLLLHHDPLVARTRAQLADIVRQWRDSLPPDDADHPLLGRKPATIRFQGSWSVRLSAHGFHSPHTHPHGWASSAFYVALPDTADAGALALGLPPAELGLPLEAERLIHPAPGRLALFPSTAWHATLPFSGEERLTLAFDIAPANQLQDTMA